MLSFVGKPPRSFISLSQNWRSFGSEVRCDIQPLIATILGLPLRLEPLYLPGQGIPVQNNLSKNSTFSPRLEP